jgi:hypothetical protein
MLTVREFVLTVVLFASIVLSVVPSSAGILWNESVNGNLSNNQAAPSPFVLAPGTNSIIGTVTGGTKPQDWVALTVPAGDELTSIVLAVYQSTDQQGFTGFQAGSTFVGSAFTAASYEGYSHYGTGATNGALPPTNLVGQDLLLLMANPALAQGAQGFTPPLGPGSYTFLIQQLGAVTAFQFDYNVARVPEPATFGLLGMGLVSLVAVMRLQSRARAK